ncbi:MAG: AGE family epimerase/isomerase [Clostridia bacterium]|nr:AGE family epimerase/isomerase [Clostridia bacterium]
MIKDEIRNQLEKKILPFWMGLKDEENGGFYGYMDNNLIVNRKADKGCILNSRILWTFSTAAMVTGSAEYRKYADHAMEFLRRFEDPEHGGVYWSVTFDGKPADTTKHTYCQAFTIYGLAAYYRLTGKQEALDKAMDLFRVIESRCKDEKGYLEALKADFLPESNEKLSENGVMASRTMNTLLHVLEAYTELYRAGKDAQVMVAAVEGLNQFLDKIYNPKKRRMEVFFDDDFRSILDMQSYGHDIEGSWLIWDSAETFIQADGREPWRNMCLELLKSSTERGFTDHGLAYEIVNGEKNTTRAWWPQAETMLGFEFGWRETGDTAWLQRMRTQWDYIEHSTVDPREGSEWFNELREDGSLVQEKPLVEEWKCPYHNGRMCLRLMQADLPETL